MGKNTANIFSVIAFQDGAIPLKFWNPMELSVANLYLFYSINYFPQLGEKKDMRLSNSMIFTTHLL